MDPKRKIGEPILGLAPVAVVQRSPTGIALLGQKVTRFALAAQGLSVAIGGVFALFLPAPWAASACAICTAVFGVASVIFGAGPGVRTQEGAAPVFMQSGESKPPRFGPEP